MPIYVYIHYKAIYAWRFCWVVLGDMTTKHIFAIVDGKQSLQIML